MTKAIEVRTPSGNYPVIIGSGLNIGELILQKHKRCKLLLVSDDTVYKLYGEKVTESLKESGFEVASYVFEHGEASKNINTLEMILETAAEEEITSEDLFVALGGGVVGDITGFASAVFLRGMNFVQIPTTLLAAVDSSVGGKTAIDLKNGKNLAGAFHQPIAVLLDTKVFDTLPKSIWAEGMAEAIKYGMILDENLFEMFEGNNYDIVDMISRCVELKAQVVNEDELDKGIRKILNFGHTPAHGIEKLSEFRIPHGRAVAMGMMIMTRASEKSGMLKEGSSERLEKVLLREGLDIKTDYDALLLANACLSDKKRRGDVIDIVLLDRIGNAVIKNIDINELQKTISLGINQ